MPLDNTNDPHVELKQLSVDLKKATDEVKGFAEKAQTEIKNLGTMTQETKDKADKALTEMNTISVRLTEVEQKIARRAPSAPDSGKTMGQLVTENDGVKTLMQTKNGQARVTVELKDITSAAATVGTGVSPTTSLVVPDRQPIVPIPLRRLVIRDLLTPGQTASSNIEYPVENDAPFTTAAAVVSEGALKPQSNIDFDLKSAPVRTVAHFMKASRQILDDAPQLQSYIDGRLRYGLQYVEELELLYGDGTGQHLNGIIPQAAAYSPSITIAGATDIDIIRLAMLQATLALYPATGTVLHPTDWARIETLKDTLGRYIIGDPSGQIAPRLWGLPVVASQAIQVGHFLTGAFQLGAQIFDRMAIEVLISTENSDDFVRNMVTIRAEERLALAVYRPTAFTTGALTS